MTDNISNETINIPDPVQSSYVRNWQDSVIEDSQLNVWSNRRISNMQYFAIDLNCSSGATGDWTFRDVNLIGFNGDLAQSYTTEILPTRWNTVATVTKSHTIDLPVENIILVPAWKIMEVCTSIASATITVKASITWTYRFVEWTTLSLTSTTPRVSVINSSSDYLRVKIQFATSASERPSFWIVIKIY